LLAYAPRAERSWQALCWQLDQRLAAIARRSGDPMIGAIRMAWWDAVLVEGDRSKGGGEPLVEHWRAIAPAGAAQAAGQLIDGWRALISPEPMSDAELLAYGTSRGGGLFALIAGETAMDAEALRLGGCLWALWDLAAHVGDEALARQALRVAQEAIPPGMPVPAGRASRPLRLTLAMVLPDIRSQRVPRHGGFTLRHYGRLLRASLRG
jgi:phytoene synthase